MSNSNFNTITLVKLGGGIIILAGSLYFGYKAGRSSIQQQEEQRENQLLEQRRVQEIEPGLVSLDNIPRYNPSNNANNILDLFNWRREEGRREFISIHAKYAVMKTLGYLTSGLTISVGTMFYLNSSYSNNRALFTNWKYQLIAALGSLVGAVGTKLVPIKYLVWKHSLWLLFCISNGAALAPFAAVSSPILLKTAVLSTSIVAGTSLLAIAVKKRSLFWLYSPLIIGSSMLLASGVLDLIYAFHPIQIARPIMSLNHQLNLYGGLILFSGYTMLDTQRLIDEAEEKGELLERRRLIRQAVNVLNEFEAQPNNNNHNNNNSSNNHTSNRRRDVFSGVGYKLGTASQSIQSAQQAVQPQAEQPKSEERLNRVVESNSSAAGVANGAMNLQSAIVPNANNNANINININLPVASQNSNPIRPPPLNPAYYPLDRVENKQFDYDYPIKPNSEEEEKKSEEELDQDLQIDHLGESVDFYLDFINIAIRILELQLRQEEESRRRRE